MMSTDPNYQELSPSDLKSDEIESMEEFFLIWESSCRNFIDDFEFSCKEASESRLRIHVFLRSDTPEEALPPQRDWIHKHFSLTTCPYASETAMVSYLTERFPARLGHEKWLEDLGKGEEGGHLILVSEKQREYEEMRAILKSRNPYLRVSEVNGREKSILDVLENVCRRCKMVFLAKNESDEHFHLMHNYICCNPECSAGRFYTENELQKHLENQTYCLLCRDKLVFCTDEEKRVHMRTTHSISETALSSRKTPDSETLVCQFCPHKSFSSVSQKEIHMRNCHKKCNCSCGSYFNSRQEYLEHFYLVYPLACYENRKCPQRFQSVLYQARHHREEHLATHPYYCVPCHQRMTEGSKASFKDEKGLRMHGMSIGHNEDEMYLTDFKESLNVDQPLQRRTPSRTCSAINYC